MKSTLIFLSYVSVTALLTQAPLHGDPLLPEGAYAVSPDHPHTWVSGADNVHQDLRWDAEKHLLVADVRYSTALYADDTHPTEENDYTMAFPAVKFDPSNNEFTVKGVKVGTLRHGFFGANIVLDKSVELDIHRHHGRIFAMIDPSERE